MAHAVHEPAALEDTVPRRGGSRFTTFASLRHRDFRLLWFGTLFMSAGQWVQQITLGWLVYDLTGSSVLLGLLNGLRALPFLISGPIAGVVADRADRKRSMLSANYVLLTTAVIMGILVAGEWVEVWHLMVFAVVTGMAWSLNQPVRQAIVPNLVPRRDLINAQALNSTAFNLNKVLGPLLGGILIAASGAAGNFFVQAVAYAGVMGMVYRMNVPKVVDSGRPRVSAWSDIKEGWRYCLRTPLVLAILVCGLIPSILAFPYQALMPVFQKDVLAVGPEALGVLFAAPGIGGMAALVLLASFGHRITYLGRLMLGALLTLGISLMAFSATRDLWLSAATLTIVGVSQVLYNNSAHILLQQIVPDELRGRVNSIYMLDHGLAPAGSLFAGITTHFFGAPWTIGGMGLLVLLLGITVAWKAPELSRWRPPSAEEP